MEGRENATRKRKKAATKYNWKGRGKAARGKGGRRIGGKEGERRRGGIKNKQFGKGLWYD